MRKINIIALIFSAVLVLTFVQCRRNVIDTVPEAVEISLNAGWSSRAIVTPGESNAPVEFEDGEKIYVVSNGKYVGILTHTGSNVFTGSIYNATAGKPLDFYLLGGKGFGPVSSLSEGATSCEVLINDQTTKYPVVSHAQSAENYDGAGLYTALMIPKCSMVKFNVTTESSEAICINGMNNKVVIDFANNKFTYCKSGEGVIKMQHRASHDNGVYWAIVFPQDELGMGAVGSAYTADENYIGVRPVIPTIEVNKFLKDGIDIVVNRPNVTYRFSVSGTTTVAFSKGNVQHIGSAPIPYWQFAVNQYTILGDNGQFSADENVDRDLFGWGSGDHPNLVSDSLSDYINFKDWALPINKVSDKEWRTLSQSEWAYLFNERSNAIYKRGVGTVNGVEGLFFLPDNWKKPDEITFDHDGCNTYNIDQWIEMEFNGAVFLPKAGCRVGTDDNSEALSAYWSSTGIEESTSVPSTLAYCISRYNATGYIDPSDSIYRWYGLAVRLVTDVNSKNKQKQPQI